MSDNKWERLLQKQQLRAEPEPQPTLYEQMLRAADTADSFRDAVEAQRKKLVDNGYPESVSWRMAADMWSGLWRGGQG